MYFWLLFFLLFGFFAYVIIDEKIDKKRKQKITYEKTDEKKDDLPIIHQ